MRIVVIVFIFIFLLIPICITCLLSNCRPSAVVVDMPWEQETLSKQDLRGMIYDEILRHHEIAKSRASKIKK